MSTLRTQTTAWFSLIVLSWMPLSAWAGLSGPPPSFVVPTQDGQHLFVMLSPVPVARDGGNECTLPGGHQVKLRDAFPASGLYRLGSTAPIWTVKWYSDQYLTRISPDGRFVVRVNEWGGGYYGEPVTPRWGIRFYDAGVQIKNYNVEELVDYPALMEFTSSDWHFLWIDHSAFRVDIVDNSYRLNTSTRESYRFDVPTGQILEERRIWRHVVRGFLATIGLCGVAAIGPFVWRTRRGRGEGIANPKRSGTRRWFSFSLRSLVGLVTAAAFAIAFPHVAVLAVCWGLACFAAWKLLCCPLRAEQWWPHATRTIQGLLAVLAWIVAYAVSWPPIRSLAAWSDAKHDVLAAIDLLLYAPLSWLHGRTPAVLLPVFDWYWSCWVDR